MYLACADKIIQQKQGEVKQLNDKLIEEFDNLPFYKKWFAEEALRKEIIQSWKTFKIWMEKRIMIEQQKCNQNFYENLNYTR